MVRGVSVNRVLKLEERIIGNKKGYLAELILKQPNGNLRYAVYGFVFNYGYYYHLQFFYNKSNFEQCKKHAYTVIDSFKIF